MLQCECDIYGCAEPQLSYTACDGEVIVPVYSHGPVRSKPMDENDGCLTKQVKVWARCVDKEPGCVVDFLCSQWCVVEKSFYCRQKRLYLVLERAEIDCCSDTVDVFGNVIDCDCDSTGTQELLLENVPAIANHVRSENEFRNDAEWCFEYWKFCFDQGTVIHPGSSIVSDGRSFLVQKVEHGRPCSLVSVEARTGF